MQISLAGNGLPLAKAKVDEALFAFFALKDAVEDTARELDAAEELKQLDANCRHAIHTYLYADGENSSCDEIVERSRAMSRGVTRYFADWYSKNIIPT
ncbi:MAG: hypothetical protein V4657_12405 [Pseudomonadota bacterium]